jgi:putative heme-binding domain-containing protein
LTAAAVSSAHRAGDRFATSRAFALQSSIDPTLDLGGVDMIRSQNHLTRAIFFWVLVPLGAQAAEPWADERLLVKDGLQVWLDATRENAARDAGKLPRLTEGDDRVDAWHDASGNRHHARQTTAQAQPRLHTDKDFTVVRFDGMDDHLANADWAGSVDEVTVIIVAAVQSNAGDWRGFMSLNADKQNDYASGMNLDLGPWASQRWETLNPEGVGFGGATDVFEGGHDFGTTHTLTFTTKPGKGETRSFIDGKPLIARDRSESKLRADRLTIGARFFNNIGAAETHGSIEADFAEVLIYDRVLSAEERTKVEAYLATKHAALFKKKLPRLPPEHGGRRLVSVESPALQMLVPGFTSRQLPVDLPNINNVKYRHDGKLVALGYNGDVYLLSDTNDDGLEDKVETFWESKGGIRSAIGFALTPKDYKHGSGMFIASKGKVSLIVDDNGDDRGDREVVVATGWKELPHGVDALGVAIDPKDHSVYFSQGTEDFGNAYLLDKEGKAHYDIKSERGTILRVAPDLKSREIYATGIRFAVGMAFNAEGDLFCTDQEGATWLPNGNPFDELLHIEKGKHYGFPPRHPKHLPNVVDEPSTFDYGPQHQSTCGINFNESVNGGPTFGPKHWVGDAIVCGYSRGKIYRTKLVKTTGGYVAQNQLIASLNMLTVDACISPKGEMVVAVHSGGPDWGTGPGANGKIYKVIYNTETPQPVYTWAQTPTEVRIAFDKPLDPQKLAGIASKVRIEYGKYVAAGDRFELHRPGYAVVERQTNTPRYDLAVHGVGLSPDRRTLVLNTARHRVAATYAVTLPDFTRGAGPGARDSGDAEKTPLPSVPEIDLQYDLTGVDAKWEGEDGIELETVLPHFDLEVARKLTAGSADHDSFWTAVEKAGKLTLNGRLNSKDFLRPAVQPGAQLDYELPKENVALEIMSSGATKRLDVTGEALDVAETLNYFGTDVPSGAIVGIEAPIATVRMTLTKAKGIAGIHPSVAVTEKETTDVAQQSRMIEKRAIALTRISRTWELSKDQSLPIVIRPPELEGGSWARGRKVFFSEQALCAKCHMLDGEGGQIGPNLSNLRQRDYASVLRDVTNPSYAINPDFVPHSLRLVDGRVLGGVIRTDGDVLLVGDEKGEVTRVARDEIDEMKASTVSVMPKDIHEKLGEAKLKDLLTFLLVAPPSMPLESKLPPPPPRSPDEIRAVLADAPNPPEKTRPIRVVLVAGPKDHGSGEHDYPAWQKGWAELLAVDDETTVETAWEWPSAEQLKTADVLVFYQHGTFNAQRAKDLDAVLARGGGAVFIHWAVDGQAEGKEFAKRIGLAAGGPIGFRHGEMELDLSAAKHPIARNFDRVKLVDETYWKLVGDLTGSSLLGTSVEEGSPTPQMWAHERGKGRVFVSIPGHYSWSFDDPLFRVLLFRGIAWTAREPVDRYNKLVPIGARVRAK